jgi:hypothetical protein
MATYYVSTTGNDSNSGGILTPWRNLSRALSAAASPAVAPGDTVRFRGGTYAESGNKDCGTAGTLSSPIVFMSEDGEQAVFDLSLGSWRLNGKGYIHLKRIEWFGGFFGAHLATPAGIPGIYMEDCLGRDLNAGGSADNVDLLRLDDVHDSTFLRLELRNVYNGTYPNSKLALSYGGYHNVFDSCIFDSAPGAGFGQKDANQYGFDAEWAVEFVRCRFKGFQSAGSAILISPNAQGIQGVRIHHSLFLGLAVETYSSRSTTQMSGLQFYNNTVINGSRVSAYIRGSLGMIAHSNIFYSSTNDGQAWVTETATDPPYTGQGATRSNGWDELDRNCYFGMQTVGGFGAWIRDRYHEDTAQGAKATNYNNLAAWRTATTSFPPGVGTSFPANHEQNSISSDPLFAETTNYTLQPGSPCRGAGKNGVDMGWQASLDTSRKRTIVF